MQCAYTLGFHSRFQRLTPFCVWVNLRDLPALEQSPYVLPGPAYHQRQASVIFFGVMYAFPGVSQEERERVAFVRLDDVN